MSSVPKILHHIWIGPNDAPLKWMQTWRNMNPEWEYRLWDNGNLFGHTWINEDHIRALYMEKKWSAVADLMRYEILFKYGGFVAPADSICLRSINEFVESIDHDAFTAYENEIKRPGLVMPLLAASDGNKFAEYLVDTLHAQENLLGGEAWQITGNAFMQDAIESYREEMISKFKEPRIKVWPSKSMIPVHYTGELGQGDCETFATHEWGSHGAYERYKQNDLL